MSSLSPKSPEQSEKSRKYDRQLRLWGDHGQMMLETSKICLINATALGTEIMKSLVLPGIGAFTIVDGEKISPEDIGSNFFLEYNFIGQSRAQIATECLMKLNADVRGDYIDEYPEHVIRNGQNFFHNFNLVIANRLSEKTLIQLSRILWNANIPLIVCQSIGLVGSIRLQIKEHAIIEAHPDNENPDLRLTNPWPELKEYLEQMDLLKMDLKKRSNVPAINILYYFIRKFQEKHDGRLPLSRNDKTEIREMIQEMGKIDKQDCELLNENFEEAIRFTNTCLLSKNIPDHVKNLLSNEKCVHLSQKSDPFWIMCAALKETIDTTGTLPVKGTLPDMSSDTESYVTLQQIYIKKANMEAEGILRRACEIAKDLGLGQDFISEQEVKLFCKHASELHVTYGTCLADEYEKNNVDLYRYLEDPESLTFYYVILRGVERFIDEFNTYPGQFDDHVEPDILKLKTVVGKLLNKWGCTQLPIRDEKVHEICRYGDAELHSISAVIGGCAAQEAIKIITHQYKPLNNTFIYDAITSQSVTLKL